MSPGQALPNETHQSFPMPVRGPTGLRVMFMYCTSIVTPGVGLQLLAPSYVAYLDAKTGKLEEMKAVTPAEPESLESREYESSLSTSEFEASRKGAQHDPDLERTVEHHPINERSATQRPTAVNKSTATRTCPKCGWEEDADARFCSVCLTSFNKTEPLNLAELPGGQPIHNPLAHEEKGYNLNRSLTDQIHDLPNNIKFGGLVAAVILLLLIIFSR